MKQLNRLSFLFCGIALMLAAFPVFAQDEAAKELKINKQPLQDLGAYVRGKVERGEMDLSQPFKVVAEVVLNKDGRLDKSKSKIVSTEGDEQMVETAKSAIEAVGNSGMFGYLGTLGAEKLKITFAQDKDKVFGIIESELATIEKAKTTASGFNTLIAGAKLYPKIGADEKTLLNAFRVTTNEKVVMINFALPAQTARELLERNMQKTAEAEKW